VVKHLRLLFWLEEDNYWVLEKSEEERVRKILEVLPKFAKWTPISALARAINDSTLSTTYTAIKLLAAKEIMQEKDYQIETIATAPIINLQKGEHNKKRSITKTNYLRAPIYIKHPTRPTYLKLGGTPINNSTLFIF